MQIWPFQPKRELIEPLEWLTDVFRAKAGEQRTALRESPRRSFHFIHVLSDELYSAARAMIRGGLEFYVPDWAQCAAASSITAGSAVAVTADLAGIDLADGDRAILWESLDNYEQVTVTTITPLIIETVVNNYTAPKLMPLVAAHAPEGLQNDRTPPAINQATISFDVTENDDLGSSSYSQYRGHDVLDTVPIIGSSSFQESIAWPLTSSDNKTSVPHYIQSRDIPDMVFQMRWHEVDMGEAYTLRQWLHSRRGRQKAFWFSSWASDLEPASTITAGSTTLNIFEQIGIDGLGRDDPFDIEIVANGTSYYRLVSVAATGVDVGDRGTIDLTIDSSLGVELDPADIDRISFLRCARFNADRVELHHRPAAGMSVQVPCIEIPVP